jgi:hypothetical protein
MLGCFAFISMTLNIQSGIDGSMSSDLTGFEAGCGFTLGFSVAGLHLSSSLTALGFYGHYDDLFFFCLRFRLRGFMEIRNSAGSTETEVLNSFIEHQRV